MKPFAAAVLLILAAATHASAFSLSVSLPNLTFPPTATSISSQNTAQPSK